MRASSVQATVGAFPSYVEGFPFAVLEKLTAGLPLIAYDAPGAREMLPAHQLVPPGDVKRMADKIAGVLDLDAAAYTRLSQRAQEVVRPLSWETIARQTMELYTRALNGLRNESLNQKATAAQ